MDSFMLSFFICAVHTFVLKKRDSMDIENGLMRFIAEMCVWKMPWRAYIEGGLRICQEKHRDVCREDAVLIKAVRRLDAVEIFYSFDDKEYTMMWDGWSRTLERTIDDRTSVEYTAERVRHAHRALSVFALQVDNFSARTDQSIKRTLDASRGLAAGASSG